MQTRPVTSADLARSVIAVPPMARDKDLKFDRAENEKILRHIEAGNVTTMLYGGNANFYHLAPSEYESVLGQLAEIAAPDTLVIPSAGPSLNGLHKGGVEGDCHIVRNQHATGFQGSVPSQAKFLAADDGFGFEPGADPGLA